MTLGFYRYLKRDDVVNSLLPSNTLHSHLWRSSCRSIHTGHCWNWGRHRRTAMLLRPVDRTFNQQNPTQSSPCRPSDHVGAGPPLRVVDNNGMINNANDDHDEATIHKVCSPRPLVRYCPRQGLLSQFLPLCNVALLSRSYTHSLFPGA